MRVWLLTGMKVPSEDSRIRRKSGPSSLFLHIPYLNYFFFFFQMRGSYNTIKNYYQIHKKVPGFLKALVLNLKFTAYNSVTSLVFFLILLTVGYNPFGKVASYFMNEAGAMVGGLTGPVNSAFYFALVPELLSFANFSWIAIGTIFAFTFITYFIFGFLGATLAAFNIKSDIRRNQFI